MDSKEQMIRLIKEKYGLNSPEVFAAIAKIPREEFIPEEFRTRAYKDEAILIGHGQTISQPYTVAFMTHLLLDRKYHVSSVKKLGRVLEIGSGSGYQAAVLSLLADKVYSVERIPELADSARQRLRKLGFRNVEVRTGSGEIGWNEKAPFDAILVTAGVEDGITDKLLIQLTVGGVMVAPVGSGEDKEMVKFIKLKNGKDKKQKYGIFRFVPFV